MGDYSKLHNFNSEANFNMVRFGGNAPITEQELNEVQAISSHQVQSIVQSVIGDRFLEGGKIALDTSSNEFSIVNQFLINQGRQLYISKLNTLLGHNETAYLDIFVKEISYTDEIKAYGNQQETTILENKLLDPRMSGMETARRHQVCFDLVKEVSRYEYETTSPVITLGELEQKTRMGKTSKIVSLEGNTYQDDNDHSDLRFVGEKQEDGTYLLPITSTNSNLFSLNRSYQGCNYEIEDDKLIVIPTIPKSWNGLSTKVFLKPQTTYGFKCDVEGKAMIHIKNPKGDLITVGDNTTFYTGEYDYVEIVFHCGAMTEEDKQATFSNITIQEGRVRSRIANHNSTTTLVMPCPLAKIGDKVDKLYTNAKGEFVIEKHTKHLTFNGEEVLNGSGWTKVQENDTTVLYELGGLTPLNDNNINVTTNYAKGSTATLVWSQDVVSSSVNREGKLHIRLSKEQVPNLDIFKALLKARPLEVTVVATEPTLIEGEVQLLHQMYRSMEQPKVREKSSLNYRYKAKGNIIKLQETRNGFTSDVYIEGNTQSVLPLAYSNSDYLSYNEEEDSITNLNKVDYRDLEDVEVLYNLDANTRYTLSFKALTDVICEIPCAELYPTVKQGETFIHTFTAKEDLLFKMKIWSPKEEAAKIEGLKLVQGYTDVIPMSNESISVGNGEQIYLVAKDSEGNEIDRQPLMYKYRGVMTPITSLQKLPNGTCDMIKQDENGVYYFHKRVGSTNLTSRLKVKEETILDNDNIMVTFTTPLTNAQPTKVGNANCSTFKAKDLSLGDEMTGVKITEEGNIVLSVPTSELKTRDKSGVSKMLSNLDTKLQYALAEEEVYECNMFDVKTLKGSTTVELECGELAPNKFTCELRENEGVEVMTFTDNTHIMFETGVAPSKVSYVASFQPKLPQEEGHIYVPIATRVESGLKDLRIFDPNLVDYVNEDKDLTTGIYTTVKALRQNGSLKYISTLSEKDERGNYRLMTVRYYDTTGQVNYHTEKYNLNYDVDGDITSKELVKQW